MSYSVKEARVEHGPSCDLKVCKIPITIDQLGAVQPDPDREKANQAYMDTCTKNDLRVRQFGTEITATCHIDSMSPFCGRIRFHVTEE